MRWRDRLAMLKAANDSEFPNFEVPPTACGKTEPRAAERELAGGLRFLCDAMATQ